METSIAQVAPASQVTAHTVAHTVAQGELPRVVAVPLPRAVYDAIKVVAEHVGRSPAQVAAALLTWKAAERSEVAAPAPLPVLAQRIEELAREWWVPTPRVGTGTTPAKPSRAPRAELEDAPLWRARLRNARTRLGMTQQDAAAHLGISRSMVHELETGRRTRHPAVSGLVDATERLEAKLAEERGW